MQLLNNTRDTNSLLLRFFVPHHAKKNTTLLPYNTRGEGAHAWTNMASACLLSFELHSQVMQFAGPDFYSSYIIQYEDRVLVEQT